ncbi:MAG: hypothetical protein HY077_07490 [Elusimicrobia bacterium]|nr:hypothetical protein [Elusimicrobiota bacterium]
MKKKTTIIVLGMIMTLIVASARAQRALTQLQSEAGNAAVDASASAAKAPKIHGTVVAEKSALPVQAFGGIYQLESCPIMRTDPYEGQQPKGLIVTVPAADSVHLETIPSSFSLPWWFNGTMTDIREINGPVRTYGSRGAKCSEFVFGLCEKEVEFKDTQASLTTPDSLRFFHEQSGNFQLLWMLRFPDSDRSTLVYELRKLRKHDYRHPDPGTVVVSCTLKRI